MDLRNLKYLHIVRGFAAFFVMLAHAKWPFWIGGNAFLANQPFSSLSIPDKLGFVLAVSSSNGTAMVIVFFVLSGFMIAHSYQKNKWTYGQFLVNRSLRIYIPYIFSVLLAGGLLYASYYLAGPLFEGPGKDYHEGVRKAYNHGLSGENFLLTLFFFRTDFNYYGFNYVYWSLLYEWLFYLSFPFILKHVRALFFISLALYPLHFFFHADEMTTFLIYFLIKFLFFFTAGVWLYQVLAKSTIQYDRIFLLRRWPLQIMIVLCYVGIAGTGFLFEKGLSFFIAAVMAMLWIIYILRYGIKRTYLNKGALFVGELSYSLYLVHVPILLFLYSLSYSLFNISAYISPWAYLLFIIPVLPVAYLFYIVFEKFSFKMIQGHKKMVHKPIRHPEPIEPSKEL